MYTLLFIFTAIQMFIGPLFQAKLHLLVLSYSVYFKAPRELWNPLSKAEPGKFHGSCGRSKRNCLQDRANFLRSRA